MLSTKVPATTKSAVSSSASTTATLPAVVTCIVCSVVSVVALRVWERVKKVNNYVMHDIRHFLKSHARQTISTFAWKWCEEYH